MRLRTLVILVVVLAAAIAAGSLASTEATEIGEGVKIKPASGPNGDYAQVGADGTVSVQFDSDTDIQGEGEGLNADAMSRFARVLIAVNTETGTNREAAIFVTDSGRAASALEFFATTESGHTSIEGRDNAVPLGAGERIPIGFAVDTRRLAAGGDASFTVHALVVEAAEALLTVETPTPTVGKPVVLNASASTGDGLRYTYDIEDGPTLPAAGPTVTPEFSKPGTYNVTVAIEETAAVGTSESDTETREIVVVGQQTTGRLETDSLVDLANSTATADRNATVLGMDVDSSSTTGGAFVGQTVAAESVDGLADEQHPQGTALAGVTATVPGADDSGTLTVVIADETVPAGTPSENLTVERYNTTSDEWEVLPTSVVATSTETVTLEAQTAGFSQFAVTAGVSAPPSAGGGGGGGGGAGGGGFDTATPDTPTPETPVSETPTAPEQDTDVPATPVSETPTPSTPTPAQDITETPASTPTESEDESGVVGLVALLAVVVLGVVVWAYRQERY